MFASGTVHTDEQVLDDQLELIYNRSMQTQDVVKRTCQVWWKIETNGETESRKSLLAGHCWRSKDELISDVRQWNPSHGRAGFGRPARNYVQQVCADTFCSQEDRPSAIENRDEWWERVREILASGLTWWWWWYVKQKTALTDAEINVHP